MQTACGAKLIATQQRMLIDDGGGGGENEGSAEAKTGAAQSGQYRGSFRAVDKDTGKPVAGRAYPTKTI